MIPNVKYSFWVIARYCLLFLVPIVLLAVYWGPQIATYLQFRRLGSPQWWNETPGRLDTEKLSSGSGTTLCYFGYQFEVPWIGVDRESNDGRTVNVQFSTGQNVSFINPNYYQEDVLSKAAAWGPKELQETWSKTIDRGSKYEHMGMALSTTPSSLRPFGSHEDFVTDRLFLSAKGLLLEHSGATALFAIQGSTYKGFEFDGSSYSGTVRIILFDSADREFRIQVSKSHLVAKLTQPEINHIIQSFGPNLRSATAIR